MEQASKAQQVLDMAQKLAGSQLPRHGDLPRIDLYMDQVLTYVDSSLAVFKRSSEDALVTKAMVNNYSKSDIIPRPERKKYAPEHVMAIMLAYHLKQTLALQDAGAILKYAQQDDMASAYDLYIEYLKRELEQGPDRLESVLQADEPDRALVQLAIRLAAEAQACRTLCERIIDALYPAQESEKAHERERDE
nr:DUF1836 domain-containing protein [bacterium]